MAWVLAGSENGRKMVLIRYPNTEADYSGDVLTSLGFHSQSNYKEELDGIPNSLLSVVVCISFTARIKYIL